MNTTRTAVNTAMLHSLRRVLIEALRILEDLLVIPSERRVTRPNADRVNGG